MSARLRESKATTAKHAQLLREMLKRPENKLCVDCKRNDPRWASTNLGVFLCIRCSGIHRGLGVHISRVRSVDLDTWTPEQIAQMDRWGNKKANIYWEAHLKAGHVPPDHKVEQFIRSKYESKRWAMEGPVPDPATLGDGDDAPVASASAPQVASSSAAVAPPPKRSAIDLLGGAFDEPAPKAAPTVSQQQPAQQQRPQPAAPAQPTGRTAAQVNGGGFFDLDLSTPATSNNTTSLSSTGSGPAKRNTADILSLFGSSSNAGGTAATQNSSASLWGNPAPSSSSSGLDAFSSLNLGGGASSSNAFSSAAPPSYSNNNSASMYPAPSSTASSSAYPVNNGMTRPSSNSISSGGNPWAAPAASTPAAAQQPSSSNNLFSSPPASSSSTSQYGFGASSNSANQSSTTTAPSGGLDLFSSQDIWGGSGNNGNAYSGSKATASASDGFGGFSSGATNKNTFDDLWG